ncbi:MAG: SCP2 sterol-binding domain-containing protein [Armatimonadetes bacterium]|nr:SCP2 sterol-binding domain-containing protein [Armatimonadota bacterium]
MVATLRRLLLNVVSYLLWDGPVARLLRRVCPALAKELEGEASGEFLGLLLGGMGLALDLSRSYRRNVRGFSAVYAIRVLDPEVGRVARFDKGRLRVAEALGPGEQATVTVTFNDTRALVDFLVAGGSDILGVLLENKVRVEGNLNYLYRFGFLVRDLTRRFDLPGGTAAASRVSASAT